VLTAERESDREQLAELRINQTGAGTTRIDLDGALVRLDPVTGPGGRIHKMRVAPARALQPRFR
jgi:hypothetical protein